MGGDNEELLDEVEEEEGVSDDFSMNDKEG